VKKQMGRKVLRPDYGKVAEWLYEGMPPEIREKFIQAFLRVDSIEEGVQKLLGVDSPEEAILKLARTKEQPEELLEFLRQNLGESGE